MIIPGNHLLSGSPGYLVSILVLILYCILYILRISEKYISLIFLPLSNNILYKFILFLFIDIILPGKYLKSFGLISLLVSIFSFI